MKPDMAGFAKRSAPDGGLQRMVEDAERAQKKCVRSFLTFR